MNASSMDVGGLVEFVGCGFAKASSMEGGAVCFGFCFVEGVEEFDVAVVSWEKKESSADGGAICCSDRIDNVRVVFCLG